MMNDIFDIHSVVYTKAPKASGAAMGVINHSVNAQQSVGIAANASPTNCQRFVGMV
jgi:hypothetical protein